MLKYKARRVGSFVVWLGPSAVRRPEGDNSKEALRRGGASRRENQHGRLKTVAVGLREAIIKIVEASIGEHELLPAGDLGARSSAPAGRRTQASSFRTLPAIYNMEIAKWAVKLNVYGREINGTRRLSSAQ